MGCSVEPKISRFSDQTTVLYFDVKPGEIVYIGNISYSYLFSYLYNQDNFESDKDKLKNTMPNIANAMQKKLMKKVLKPKECDFIIAKILETVYKNLPRSSVKLDPSYPACIKALEKIGTDNEINNKGFK